MTKIAIVTPTYNEAENIGELLDQLEQVCQDIPDVSFTIVVVDDSSPDGTAEVARKAAASVQAANVAVTVLERQAKEGVGKAYIDAFQRLLKEDFDFFIQIDADLSHNPGYIRTMVAEASSGRDFVATSRYMEGGGIHDWNLYRRIISRCGNIYTRLWLDRRITDYTNGLNLFSTDLLRRVDVDSLDVGGYGFFIELKYRALQHARSFKQIPLILTDRRHGQSKLPKSTIFTNFLLVPRLRVSRGRKSKADD